MNLPLSTAFTVFHKLWVVVFSFSFISMHILVCFLISSMICWLFRSVLFILHMLEFFIVFYAEDHVICEHPEFHFFSYLDSFISVFVSWGKPVLLWTFPLVLLLQCPIGLGCCVFIFIRFYAYLDLFFDFFYDLLVIQKHVV